MGRKNKILVGKNEVMNIKKFMRICGFESDEERERITHEKMEKKIIQKRDELSKKKYLSTEEISESSIILPKRANYDDARKDEKRLKGEYYTVRDDKKKMLIYKNPTYISTEDLLEELQKTSNPKKLDEIRRQNLKEAGYEESASGVIRKIEAIEEEPEITEKINRNNNVYETGHGRVRVRRNYY